MRKNSLCVCIVLMAILPAAWAADLSESTSTWIDITKEVAANPQDKGGWTVDKNAKVYRSEDGNKIKVEHSEYGEFVIELKEGTVKRMVDKELVLQKNSTLLNREGGMMLVIRTSEHKFRLRFTEKVSGMQAVEGIRGM
jgi:hypothetical protein